MVQLLTIPETAVRLSTSRRTVERHIASGRLRARRATGSSPWRVAVADLEAFVASWDTNEPTARRLRAVAS